MGYLKGYEFSRINLNINNYLRLSKKIRFIFNCWNPIPDNELYIHEKLTLKIGKTKSFKISRNNLTIKSELLTETDNKKLNNYLHKYGNNLLDYEQRKVNYQQLDYLP